MISKKLDIKDNFVVILFSTLPLAIIIGNFYTKKWASGLVDILVNENIKKDVFVVKKLSKNNYQLSAGPYLSINTLKSDYFKLNKYGFDNLDIEKHK